jgi:hypothetical protein
MGKPIGEAEGEADKSALTAKYYAEHGPGVLADEHMDIDGSETWVACEQLGGSETFLDTRSARSPVTTCGRRSSGRPRSPSLSAPAS